jgi:hypothetical protein
MDLYKPFKIVIGVFLLLSSITIFALLFLEPDILALLFNFSINVTAENLSEVIAGMVTATVAALFFGILMFILGIFYFIFYVVIGSLVLALKRSKTILIIAAIISSFALFLEARTTILAAIAGFTSIILIICLISDCIIIGFSIYLLVQLFKSKEITSRV